MTVCIAVACQEGKESRIVLCSDTRLDYADLGSTNLACKFDVLGHGWCVQMAGEWSGTRKLCAILQSRVQSLAAVHSQDIENEAKTSIFEFMQSPLYQTDAEYQLLISGFDNNTPIIYTLSVSQGKSKMELKDNFGCIGWGYTVATTLLSLRECNPAMPLAYAAYLAYEAKRACEKTGLVGPMTALIIHSPNVPDFKDKAYVRIMDVPGLAQLDAYYRGLWKIPLVKFPAFTDEFFMDTKKPESP